MRLRLTEEVAEVDAVIDGLSSPTSLEACKALRPFSRNALIGSLVARLGREGASGSDIPIADPTSTVVDSTTYDNGISGSGKLTTLVFPADTSALAIALDGDDYPRWVLSADATSYGILMGDGTQEPTNLGTTIVEYSMANNGDGTRAASIGANGVSMTVGGPNANTGPVLSVGPPLLLGGSVGPAMTGGTGAPSVGGNVGDLFFLQDGGAGTTIYQCTGAGTAGNATWGGIL